MALVKEQADRKEFLTLFRQSFKEECDIWFDWYQSFNGAPKKEEFFLVMLNGEKVGGYLCTEGSVCFPFLIAPYHDSFEFFKFVTETEHKDNISGVSEAHAEVLKELGYQAVSENQVMYRATEKLVPTLKDPFTAVRLSEYYSEKTKKALGQVIVEEYLGNGEVIKLEDATKNIEKFLETYKTENYSLGILDRTGNPVSVCFAGLGEGSLHQSAEIADICVSPAYQDKGFGPFFVDYVVNEAHGKVPFVKLLIPKDSPARAGYQKLGFKTGPAFVNLK